MKPLVSVVVPAYNAEGFLNRALDSVVNQTLDDYEIVVVDDGSTDQTPAIAASYPKTRVIRQSNLGASAARNRGAQEARGKYVAFLDADDAWHCQKLALQTALAESLSRPQLITCHGFNAAGLEVPLGQWLTRPVQPHPEQLSVLQAFGHPYYPTASYFIGREHFLRLQGFDETLPTAEDVDFIYRAAQADDGCTFLRNRLVVVVDRENSLGEGLRSYQDNLHVVDRFFAQMKDVDPRYRAEHRRLQARILSGYSASLYRDGQWLQSIAKAVQALRLERQRKRLINLLKRLVPPPLYRALRGRR